MLGSEVNFEMHPDWQHLEGKNPCQVRTELEH